MSTKLELEVFRSLDAFIGPQLSSIASTISEQCALHALQSAQITVNPDMKFVYFNRLNYAFKTSVSVLSSLDIYNNTLLNIETENNLFQQQRQAYREYYKYITEK